MSHPDTGAIEEAAGWASPLAALLRSGSMRLKLGPSVCRWEGCVVRQVAWLLVVIGFVAAAAEDGLAQDEKRVALVVGNSAYQYTRALPNPKNDAEAIAALLREKGFASVELQVDLDYRAMRKAMRVFGEAARQADVALVYYAGHGLEFGAENYLLPIDAKVARDSDLEWQAVTLKSVLGSVANARRLRLVILDACRNNPLGERVQLDSGVMRSVTRGLAH